MLRKIIVIILSYLFYSQSSFAMECKIIDIAGNKQLYMRGEIVEDDAQKCISLINKNQKSLKAIILNSAGGLANEAQKISETVQKLGLTTAVPIDGVCNSACVSIFASGKSKNAHPHTTIAVHRPANFHTKEDNLYETALLAVRYRDLNIPENIIEAMLKTPFEKSYKLNLVQVNHLIATKTPKIGNQVKNKELITQLQQKANKAYDIDEKIIYLEQIKILTNDINTIDALIEIYENENDLISASKNALLALKDNKYSSQHYLKLSQFAAKLNREKEALSYLEQFYKSNPNKQEAITKINILTNDENIKIRSVAQKLDITKQKLSFEELLDQAKNTDNRQQQITILEQAYALQEDNIIVLDKLSNLYIEEGDYIKAVEYLNKIISFLPNSITHLFKLAEISSEQEDLPKTIEYLQQFYDNSPSQIFAINKISALNNNQTMEQAKTIILEKIADNK